MVVIFAEERKKQKKLIYIFIAVMLITLVVLWLGVLRKPQRQDTGVFSTAVEFRKAEIDFKVLEKPILKELQPFKNIEPFGGETGRENPFVPY